MIEKSIKTIFWDIPEPEYRKDPALSQSTISSYARVGFEGLNTLFKPITSPSLTFGSCVDCILTDGEKEFEKRFFISDVPTLKPSVEPVVKEVFNRFGNAYTNINDIPYDALSSVINEMNYRPDWKSADTKRKSIRTEGADYYQRMFMAGGRTIISQETYNKVFACVRALKDSPQTKKYFCADDPFDDIERVYQQKFKQELDGVVYRGMSDLLVVDHKNKFVLPCDLKTSHNREYNFPKSFIEFRYDIQARLYWRLIRKTMDSDEYFKNFRLLNFHFIVVNNFDTPVPLVWRFRQSSTNGTIIVGDHKLHDPETIGKELRYHLDHPSLIPRNIHLDGANIIEDWFNDNNK